MMRKKPMLAYPVSDKPIDYTKPVFMQPKLDGVRCLIQYDGTESLVAYSRTGKVWKNINHILYELIPFFKKKRKTNLGNIHLKYLLAKRLQCIYFYQFLLIYGYRPP